MVAVDTPIETSLIQSVLDGRWADMRDKARTLSADERFAVVFGEDTETQRARVLERMHALTEYGYPRNGFPTQYGGTNDLGRSITGFEMLAMGDLSLLVKSGVQWGLFGGAIPHLGTERHHAAYLHDLVELRLFGCFAMTEHGHGSDVAHLATTATFDAETDEFVIRTPHEDAGKEYIGNAARDGRMAVVFAQLVTCGEGQGVHAFVVPIRDDAGRALPGVRTVLLQLVAKELLTGYRDHFGELDLLETLARPLRRAAGADDPFAVFNAAQDHLLGAARAHVDNVLLNAFVDAVGRLPAGPEQDLLITVCDLFALSTLEAERGWLDEHGRLTAPRSKAIVAAVNELCRELRPHAQLLVDAFAIPPAALDVPILHD